ncbi:MAG: hypothetical protein UT34_C0001G0259 [candidate division WS6 bacterium GW2011_GWF2_39_15]|uniref:Prepilin-type N-terminal cleavage/methylation domain-containing protein n=1 Tax=candidate division WS6 bacterium GW2011_GWF2_39_15 TaxID=1619100 RepID=A0A0G0MQB1_9BACT|nr:MAG: hypothetical protein UT34_C0001G0259 [candidate division WS6 bacterium GW2011_GWF2_39_15]
MKKGLRRSKQYSGVSLIEVLITMVIIGVVMILVSITLTTMIRTSIISTSRTATREESEFILELLRKTIRNSNTEDLRIYNVGGRAYNNTTGMTIDSSLTGYESTVTDGVSGTEIHFRPVGYGKWICVGFFPDYSDNTRGYVLKSVRQDLETSSDCFNSATSEYSQNTILLNSEDVDVNSLSLVFFPTYDENYLLTIDLDMEPIHWIANSDSIKPNYFKQTVVSTQKLTWED